MKKAFNCKRPEWYEKKALICKNCGHSFFKVKVIFAKCSKCGSWKVVEDKSIVY